QTVVNVNRMRAIAAPRSQDRPSLGVSLDWERIRELRGLRALNAGDMPELFAPPDPSASARVLARRAYAQGKFSDATAHWGTQGGGAQGPMDLTMLAEIFAAAADPRAEGAIEALRPLQPAEAEVTAAWALFATNHSAASTERLAMALTMYRDDAWAHREV